MKLGKMPTFSFSQSLLQWRSYIASLEVDTCNAGLAVT